MRGRNGGGETGGRIGGRKRAGGRNGGKESKRGTGFALWRLAVHDEGSRLAG